MWFGLQSACCPLYPPTSCCFCCSIEALHLHLVLMEQCEMKILCCRNSNEAAISVYLWQGVVENQLGELSRSLYSRGNLAFGLIDIQLPSICLIDQHVCVVFILLKQVNKLHQEHNIKTSYYERFLCTRTVSNHVVHISSQVWRASGSIIWNEHIHCED